MVQSGIVRRLTRAPAWIVPSIVMIASVLAFLAGKPGQAAEGGLTLVPGALPNYIALGAVGVANDYVGSDDTAMVVQSLSENWHVGGIGFVYSC